MAKKNTISREERQALFDKFYIEGGEDFGPGNALRSAIAAGYSETTARAKGFVLAGRARVKTAAALDALGCDGFSQAKKLLDLREAQMVKWNPAKGGTRKKPKGGWDSFADNHTQLSATQEINKIQDSYPAPKESGTGDARSIQIVFPPSFADLMNYRGSEKEKSE